MADTITQHPTGWTAEQRDAIEVRGRNMLVSAAAGSGKTAVLTERIRRLVTEERVPVSSLLVVTFTEAAAAEMRRRIEDAIGAALGEDGDDDFLRVQLRRLRMAQISTFHAFALSILKNYYYIIGMEPAFRVCDEFRAALMKQDALDLLFEESFASASPDGDGAAFTDFLSRYADSRGENGVRDMILRVHSFVRSLPEPFVWLDESVGRLGASDEEFRAGAAFSWLRRHIASELERAADEIALVGEMLADAGVAGLAGKNAVDLAAVRGALQAFAGGAGPGEADMDGASGAARGAREAWDAMAGALTFRFQVFSAKKDEKESFSVVRDEVKVLRDSAKKRLKTLLKTYFMRPLAESLSDVRDTWPQAAELARLVRRFDELFSEIKRDEGVIDFDDIEHFALAILDDEKVSAELREKYEYLFVDEYQDSNYVQEALLSKVCRTNNRFMVGDVKQSIYRFRHAEPGLFAEKYAGYPRVERGTDPASPRLGEGDSCRVDLNMNFRSKTPVIAAVNGVFRRLMAGGVFEEDGGIAYDEAAALKPGLSYDAGWDSPVELIVVDAAATGADGAGGPGHGAPGAGMPEEADDAEDGDAFAEAGPEDESAFSEAGPAAGIDEEIASLRDAEREALAAAAVIREARGRVFYDAKAGAPRPMGYGDMVVLLREARISGPVFTEILLGEGIDAYAESGDGYLDTVEIETFMHLLRVIDNARQDIPLVSALYSPVFGFGADELAEIRTASADRGAPFYRAFLACAAGAGVREELAAKCAAAAARIDAWRREESFMELSDFLWLVLKESGWYDYAGALVGGALRQANLLAMTVRAAEYGSGRARGLFGFIRYIESVGDRKLPVPQAKLVTEGEDVVRVMTVHKSKGLEYPLVIVAGLGKRLMTVGRGGRLALHRELGLALTCEAPETYTWRRTLLMTAVLGRAAEEERAELLRVLYVAMTRAQDRLVLIGSRRGAAESIDLLGDAAPGDRRAEDGRLRGVWAVPGADARRRIGPDFGKTFLDMLLPLAREAGMELSVVTRAGLARTIEDGEAEGARASEKLAEVSVGATTGEAVGGGRYAEVDRRLSFVYPHASAARLKSKYSVSELNRRRAKPQAHYYMEESEAAVAEDEGRAAGLAGVAAGDEIADLDGGLAAADERADADGDLAAAGAAGPAAAGAAGRSALSAAERGVVLHKALEKLDYAEARARCSAGDSPWFEAYLDGLVSGGFLTPGQRASVGAGDLMNFASSDICARAAASPRVRRETPFNYRVSMEGERVIVQGVIDLFFEEGDGLVLVDFKSGGAGAGPGERASRAVESYGEQIRLYRAALEDITGKRVEESLLYLTTYGQTVVVPREVSA